MKVKVEDDIFFAIRDEHVSSNLLWFWGQSPYGGMVECNSVEHAYRFDTRERARAKIREYAEENQMRVKDVQAKVVRVRMRTTATIY